MKKTLAIFSPVQNAYSESFIQAHRRLDFKIKFYYGNYLPNALESDKNIFDSSISSRIKRRLLRVVGLEEKKLLYSLRKEKVDVVLAEYGPTAAESLDHIKQAKLPLIVHFHGFDASDKGTIQKYNQYKEVFEYANKVIAVSNKMKEVLLNLGCPEDKLVLNTYGPDDSFFSLKPGYKQPYFVAVGRFVPKKAPHLTIQAFKKVVEKFPDAKLIMAGDGYLLEECRTLSAALGLKDNVVFAGVLNKEEIKVLFQNSIAFVQHSVVAETGDSEGTPVAILEAQAAGLPVISTYHAGIPDVVLNGETGLLVEEHDVEGMSKNMIRVLEEEGLANRLGEAARKRVKQHFTMEKHLKKIDEIISKSLDDK